MAKNQTTQRMINTPQTTLAANPGQSSVIGGNGVVNNGVTVKVPPSISNPASLNPTTTPPKTTGQTPAPVFSDNMTKPAYTTPTTTPAPTTTNTGKAPVVTPPTTPVTTPTTPELTGVDKVNAETRARVEAERNAQLIQPTATEGAPEGWDMKTGIFDKNNYLGQGITEDEFYTLPFEQQQHLIDQATLDVNQKKRMQDQLTLAADITHQKEYATELNDLNTQISGLNKENAKINSARTVANAQKDFDTLQQNLGFLGSGGRPVKSTASMNSMARQLVDAQGFLNNVKQLEENKQKMMELGIEFDSKQFEEQIFQLNQKMKKEIDASILAAIQGFTSEQMRGYLDTPQKMFEAQNRYLNSVDNSVTGITNRTVQQLKSRQDFYAKQAETNMKLLEEDRKTQETMRQEKVAADIEFKKQANTVNDKLSAQTGYLTDGNGEVMVDKKTGMPIAYDPFAAEKPTVTADGQVVTFSKDPVTGKIVASFQQLWKKPKDVQIIGYDDMTGLAIYGTVDENGNATPIRINGSTNNSFDTSSDPVNNPKTLEISNPQTLQQIIDFCTDKRNSDKVQCGMLVNDYILKITGQNPSGDNRFQDSLESKITAIDNIGRATGPVAGGIFAYDTNNQYGHTGIVTKINNDGSIEVLEANVKGSEAGGPPKVTTYPASKYKNWVFSQAPAGQKEAEAGVNAAGNALKNIPQQQEKTKFTGAQENQFKNYNGNSIPEEYKTPKAKQVFLDNYSKRKSENPQFYNKTERAEIQRVYDNLAQDPSYKAYETVRSKQMAFNDIRKALEDGAATAQDKQALISDFAKVLDPTSVVREGEYALAAKYSQSKMNQYKQEAYNYVTVGGPLSDQAALLLSKGLERQYAALGKAHDAAIDDKKKGVEILLGRPVDVEALQTSYSHTKNKQTNSTTSKNLSGGTNRLANK